MKFKKVKITRQVPHTVDGTTNLVEKDFYESVPKLPRDWDVIAMRGAAGLVLTLTVIAVVWSTVSIGHLLNGGVGYAAAVLFDIAWAVTILLEWLGRYDAAKRKHARWAGWGLLVVTMAVIAWHGLLLGSVALAVVGALVSFVAKLLWLGIMRHVDRDLSPEDRQWVEAEISKAHATEAIAQVRRKVQRIEARAAVELLASERDVREMHGQGPAAIEVGADIRPETASQPARMLTSQPASKQTSGQAASGARPDVRPALSSAQLNGVPAFKDIRPDIRPVTRDTADTPGDVRPDMTDTARPAPDTTTATSVPAPATEGQRPPSVRAAVADLYAAGHTEPREMATELSHAYGRAISPDTVGRYLRELRAANRDAQGGGYL